jgi:hypothetical protein
MGGIATLTGATYGQTVTLVNEGTAPLAVVPISGYTLTHKAVSYTSTSPLWVPVGGAATFVQFATVFYPVSANFATLAPQAQAVPATQNYLANYFFR